jgi:hypothetical protein
VLRGVKKDIGKTLKQKFNVSADVVGVGSAIKNAKDIDQLDWLQFAVTRLTAECIATDDPRLKGN